MKALLLPPVAQRRSSTQGSTDNIVLSGLTFNKPNTAFSILGVPTSYVVEIEGNMAFPKISGHLSWGGLKGIPLLLENDKLELIGFEGTLNQVEGYTSMIGKADKIKLNGVDIGLG